MEKEEDFPIGDNKSVHSQQDAQAEASSSDKPLEITMQESEEVSPGSNPEVSEVDVIDIKDQNISDQLCFDVDQSVMEKEEDFSIEDNKSVHSHQDAQAEASSFDKPLEITMQESEEGSPGSNPEVSEADVLDIKDQNISDQLCFDVGQSVMEKEEDFSIEDNKSVHSHQDAQAEASSSDKPLEITLQESEEVSPGSNPEVSEVDVLDIKDQNISDQLCFDVDQSVMEKEEDFSIEDNKSVHSHQDAQAEASSSDKPLEITMQESEEVSPGSNPEVSEVDVLDINDQNISGQLCFDVDQSVMEKEEDFSIEDNKSVHSHQDAQAEASSSDKPLEITMQESEDVSPGSNLEVSEVNVLGKNDQNTSDQSSADSSFGASHESGTYSGLQLFYRNNEDEFMDGTRFAPASYPVLPLENFFGDKPAVNNSGPVLRRIQDLRNFRNRVEPIGEPVIRNYRPVVQEEQLPQQPDVDIFEAQNSPVRERNDALQSFDNIRNFIFYDEDEEPLTSSSSIPAIIPAVNEENMMARDIGRGEMEENMMARDIVREEEEVEELSDSDLLRFSFGMWKSLRVPRNSEASSNSDMDEDSDSENSDDVNEERRASSGSGLDSTTESESTDDEEAERRANYGSTLGSQSASSSNDDVQPERRAFSSSAMDYDSDSDTSDDTYPGPRASSSSHMDEEYDSDSFEVYDESDSDNSDDLHLKRRASSSSHVDDEYDSGSSDIDDEPHTHGRDPLYLEQRASSSSHVDDEYDSKSSHKYDDSDTESRDNLNMEGRASSSSHVDVEYDSESSHVDYEPNTESRDHLQLEQRASSGSAMDEASDEDSSDDASSSSTMHEASDKDGSDDASREQRASSGSTKHEASDKDGSDDASREQRASSGIAMDKASHKDSSDDANREQRVVQRQVVMSATEVAEYLLFNLKDDEDLISQINSLTFPARLFDGWPGNREAPPEMFTIQVSGFETMDILFPARIKCISEDEKVMLIYLSARLILKFRSTSRDNAEENFLGFLELDWVTIKIVLKLGDGQFSMQEFDIDPGFHGTGKNANSEELSLFEKNRLFAAMKRFSDARNVIGEHFSRAIEAYLPEFEMHENGTIVHKSVNE